MGDLIRRLPSRLFLGLGGSCSPPRYTWVQIPLPHTPTVTTTLPLRFWALPTVLEQVGVQLGGWVPRFQTLPVNSGIYVPDRSLQFRTFRLELVPPMGVGLTTLPLVEFERYHYLLTVRAGRLPNPPLLRRFARNDGLYHQRYHRRLVSLFTQTCPDYWVIPALGSCGRVI